MVLLECYEDEDENENIQLISKEEIIKNTAVIDVVTNYNKVLSIIPSIEKVELVVPTLEDALLIVEDMFSNEKPTYENQLYKGYKMVRANFDVLEYFLKDKEEFIKRTEEIICKSIKEEFEKMFSNINSSFEEDESEEKTLLLKEDFPKIFEISFELISSFENLTEGFNILIASYIVLKNYIENPENLDSIKVFCALRTIGYLYNGWYWKKDMRAIDVGDTIRMFLYFEITKKITNKQKKYAIKSDESRTVLINGTIIKAPKLDYNGPVEAIYRSILKKNLKAKDRKEEIIRFSKEEMLDYQGKINYLLNNSNIFSLKEGEKNE